MKTTESRINELSLIDIITSEDSNICNLSLATYCANADPEFLLEQCNKLDSFRRTSENLYKTVRALFFLYAIHRFHLKNISKTGDIPHQGYRALLEREFDDAIEHFLCSMRSCGPSEAISSALATAYYKLGFQTLANQVRSSVKNHPGNSWMFDVKDPQNQPRRIHKKLMEEGALQERTPVRMDLSHCGWSDIFFLGMDFPEGARVLNISVDLVVHGRQNSIPIPPIDTFLRVIDEPILRLISVDLKSTASLTMISEVFDFCKDYLGLLRAGIIASGIIPPGLEDSNAPLSALFGTMFGVAGKGLELTTRVNDIPKGSRLAVSTNLLGSIIAIGMRATGQTENFVGKLTEAERLLVAGRAILGEWLGGSGGGWQDSGGVWPGIKLIEGVKTTEGDPEYGISRGRLLPTHRQLSEVEAPVSLRTALDESLVLVHGGMSQNVGPVLEMVTEKYLLREPDEWKARHDALGILDGILAAFAGSNILELAKLTTRNFFEPIQTIIPWATNLYTETLIERMRERFGESFWGFLMLGGCSGGGMGFIFDPKAKPEALNVVQEIMMKTKGEMEDALPFAMDPVVYNFSINEHGTMARWCNSHTGKRHCSDSSLAPKRRKHVSLDELLFNLGFNTCAHEKIRADLKNGVIGLAQNRLPENTRLENVQPKDIIVAEDMITPEMRALGLSELEKGTVGVVTLAAGVGSRWTQGAGVVKAMHPFSKLGGRHRSFLEVHLAKSRRISQLVGTDIPHVFTTSHITDGPIDTYLERVKNHDYKGSIYLSHGKSIGLRFVPTIRDIKFAWEELQQQKLDEREQKVRESSQNALMSWIRTCGEATDYRDNVPLQCLHPVGHFFEIPNLMLNGKLHQMLTDRPQLKVLMLHNVDTVGADVDPGMLGLFLDSGKTLSFEVVPRRIEDQGGGLARVNGTVRLVEGLSLPREEDEFKFWYYNSMTTWIDIDKLLATFGLERGDLSDTVKVANAVSQFSHRLPTYVTIKDVKKRLGNGHEDVYPVAQFEKLWSDLSALDDVKCQFVVVPRQRGQQLKEISQLDGWLRDGSAEYLESICSWE